MKLSSPVSMQCRHLNTLTTVSNTHIGLIWCRPFWRVHTPGYEVLTPVKMHTVFMEAACFCRGERSRDICTHRVQRTLGVGSGDCKEWPWSVVDLTVGNQLPWQPHKLVNPYPTAFPYGNGMVLHFYQQQESSTTKTVHKVINKGLKTYV